MVDVQRAQKEVLNNIREDKDFDSVRQDEQKHESVRHKRKKLRENCGTGHPQRRCPSYGKMCSGFSRANCFKVVCKSMQRQWQGQRLPRSCRSTKEVLQNEKPSPLE